MANNSREGTRQWLEADAPEAPLTLDQLLEPIQKGDEGMCFAHLDGSDTTVTLLVDGEQEMHECVGAKWGDFRRHFFEVPNNAIEGSSARTCP